MIFKVPSALFYTDLLPSQLSAHHVCFLFNIDFFPLFSISEATPPPQFDIILIRQFQNTMMFLWNISAQTGSWVP